MAAQATGKYHLVIVESATKADKIQNYLGDGYIVTASIGHIRDLPSGAADVPAKYKKEKWAHTGVNVDDDFTPLYVVNPDRKAKVRELKELLKDADELILATDPDREGEAIAWHLLEVLKPKVPVKRMVFHEITPEAINDAITNTRDLDLDLVEAQEARRIVDRLYGYEVSPVLWRKVMPRLSAGRVQSVATRMIVERERERMAFVSAGYWDLTAQLSAPDRASDTHAVTTFPAKLVEVNGQRIAQGRDFDDKGQLKSGKATQNVMVLDEAGAHSLAEALQGLQGGAGQGLAVTSVEEKPYTRRPYAPFMTSTLQQDAARKLHFSSRSTMQVAQRLYENGYITYMRTDSVNLSQEAVQAARRQATELYGADAVPAQPRVYAKRNETAQEAHEAIRPAGDSFRTPAQVKAELRPDEFRLYELIWKRTVASQMADAKGYTATLRLSAAAQDGRLAQFSASGTVITFKGFLDAYEEGRDAEVDGENAEAKDRRLPQVAQGEHLTGDPIEATGHETSPPARYTEASIVAELERREIGRPSTYAPTISTIMDRGYVSKRGTALVPSWTAFAVIGLLEDYFAKYVDYDFTARMEDDLDRIAAGELGREAWLQTFYFGAPAAETEKGVEGLKHVVDNLGEIDARAVNSLPITEDITLRVGQYGPYLERSLPADAEAGATPPRANVPEDLAPDELTPAKAEELFATAQPSERELGTDPETGRTIVAKDGRYGPYVTEVIPEMTEEELQAWLDAQPTEYYKNGKPKPKKKPAKEKPRTGSLFTSMSVDTVTLEQALQLMSLPRVVGADAEGEVITAQNGRFGPYLKKGSDSRSLESEDQIFSITQEQALEIYAQPKQRGRGAAKPPLAEFGEDPVSGKKVTVKEGRFGPYVTDGVTNITVPRGRQPEELTAEEAYQLLADKRAKGPATRGGAKKPAARKAPAKKTTARKKA